MLIRNTWECFLSKSFQWFDRKLADQWESKLLLTSVISARRETLRGRQFCTVMESLPSQSGGPTKSCSPQVGAPGKCFSDSCDTSCSGFTLPWQANGWALMVLPIKPQSFVAAQTHFSLSFCGLQQTTHVTFVWVIYCLGKGSMKLLFRENHWNSLAGSIRITSFRNITTKLSLTKWKYSEGKGKKKKKNLCKSNQQNSLKLLIHTAWFLQAICFPNRLRSWP